MPEEKKYTSIYMETEPCEISEVPVKLNKKAYQTTSGFKIINKKKQTFKINVANARHELPLLKEIMGKHKFEEVSQKNKKADMAWQWPMN